MFSLHSISTTSSNEETSSRGQITFHQYFKDFFCELPHQSIGSAKFSPPVMPKRRKSKPYIKKIKLVYVV